MFMFVSEFSNKERSSWSVAKYWVTARVFDVFMAPDPTQSRWYSENVQNVATDKKLAGDE